MGNTLQQLRANLESAEAAMRSNPSGGTPDRNWVGSQLVLVRLLEEAGTISGEWDGLFIGLLDDLMVAKRHRQRQIDVCAAGVEDGEIIRRIEEFSRTNDRFNEKAGEFILKFGDRLALKAEDK